MVGRGSYRLCAVLEGRPGSFRVRPIGHYLDRGLVGRTAVLAEAAGVWRAGAAGGRVDRYAFRWHLSILGAADLIQAHRLGLAEH